MKKNNSKFIDLDKNISDLSDDLFLKTLVHESNNFLSPISGFTEILLMEESFDPKQRSYLEEVTTAVQRHVEFNLQLLMLSGNLNPTTEAVSSDEFIELIDSGKFNINSKLTGLVYFKASRTWLIKVVGALESFATSLQQSSTDVCLSKQDNYLRVTTKFSTKPDAIDRSCFFQPFYTSRKLSSEKGLGLCWLPSLMKSMGGEIQLEIEALGEVELSLFFPLASLLG